MTKSEIRSVEVGLNIISGHYYPQFSPDTAEILSPMGEIAERGETKYVEHLNEIIKLVKIILNNYCLQPYKWKQNVPDAHPHDMVHIPAKFQENTAMHLRVSVKTNMTDRQTDRTGKTTPTVSNNYLIKPLLLSLSTK